MLVIVKLPALLTTPEKTNRAPGATGLGGHSLVNVNRGVGIMGQTAVALAVTLLCVQTSLAFAVTVSAMFVSHVFVGTIKFPVKLADSPGASVIGPRTGVLFVGRLSTTI